MLVQRGFIQLRLVFIFIYLLFIHLFIYLFICLLTFLSFFSFVHFFLFHFILFTEMKPNENTWLRADIAPKINHDGRELTYTCAAAICQNKRCKKYILLVPYERAQILCYQLSKWLLQELIFYSMILESTHDVLNYICYSVEHLHIITHSLLPNTQSRFLQKRVFMKLTSSNINEVIRPVLNFLFFFTIRFHKYKKA